MDLTIVSKPIIGALIGYSTNWLAIKMLFKPHNAVIIGKFRVPFTPGLIPRERERIARSLGTAVGEQLLTEEVVSKELLNEKVISQIKDYVSHKLLDQNITVESLLKKALGENYPSFVIKVSKEMEAQMVNGIKTDAFGHLVHQSIRDYLVDQFPHNKSMGDLLPETLSGSIKEILMLHKDGIASFVVRESQSENVKMKLTTIVSELINEKVGALGAMFVNPESITESILAYIEKSVYEAPIQEAMIDAILKGFDQTKGMALSELIPISQYDEIVDHVGDLMEEGAQRIISDINISGILRRMIESFLQKNIQLTTMEKENIANQIVALYSTFIQTNIGTFLETFEVKRIVEAEVNRFSVQEIEHLIFDIVNKELNAITWFGALLGLVMGTIMIFF